MSDHPSTFKGMPGRSGKTAWGDHATLHRIDDGDGVLGDMKSLRRGTFSEMIRHLMMLPEQQRANYLIEKAGDRQYSAVEAAELAAREDFPSTG